MALWEYIGAWSGMTKLLLHLNWNANDSSWNGNNWTATNVSWVGGRLWSGSASWNGTNAKIQLPNPIINTWTVVSFCLWVNNWAASQAADTTIITNQLDSSWLKGFVIWQRPNAWNSWNLFYWDWLWNFQWINTNLFALDVWVWTHIWWVINWNNIKIYKNWSLLSNATYANNINLTTTSNMSLLSWVWSNRYFNGQIDEVIVENIAWTDAQMKKQYTSQLWRYWIL